MDNRCPRILEVVLPAPDQKTGTAPDATAPGKLFCSALLFGAIQVS